MQGNQRADFLDDEVMEDCSNGIQDEKITSNYSQEKEPKLQQHAVSMLSVMQSLWREQQLCDVTLSVQGRHIQAHRLVLAACSPYFNAMFTSEVRERTEDVIILHDLAHDAVEAVVDFAYTAKVSVNEENVQALLKAAIFLHLESVQVACCNFLKSQLDPSNCVGIRRFAELHSCYDLQITADAYIQKHFPKVALNEEFLHLATDDLLDLIARDTLNVKNEEQVYHAVIAWIKHDYENRMKEIDMILEHVRLPLCSWEFLTSQVAKDSIVTGNKIGMKFYNDAKLYHAQEFHPQLQGELNIRTLPRDSFCQAKYIYAVGGETTPGRCTISSVERYNVITDCWTPVTSMKTSRRGVGVAISQSNLYAVGGSDGLNALNCVECYDLQSDVWRMVAPLNVHRSSVAVATCLNHLYAFGGYNGMTTVNTAERYNPNNNEWTPIQDMASARSMAGVVMLGGCLYIIGGYNDTGDLNTVERYNPKTKQWSMVSSMQTCRSMLGAAVLNGKIYVAGGCQHDMSLSSVEMYNPATDSWSLICPMTQARSGVGVVVLQQKLYCVGGYDGDDYLRTVEVYDPEKDIWSIGTCMTTCRRRFGCCC